MKRKLLLIVTLSVMVVFVLVGCGSNTQTVLFAYLSADQAIPDSTNTDVVFDTVDVDELEGYDNTTGVYTVQGEGDYHVTVNIDWLSTFTTGDFITYDLVVNDTDYLSFDVDAAGGNEAENFSASLHNLQSGDTVKVEVYQSSGGSKSIYGTDTDRETWISIDRLQ